MSETDETRGLTLREIVLDMSDDLKEHLRNGHPDYPTRREMWAVLIGVGGLLFAALRI